MRKLLRAHLRAPNYVATARTLAAAAGYKSWRTVNRRYGLLAHAIGEHMNTPVKHLGLLVELIAPGQLANKEWIVLMRPAFARGLVLAKWV